MLKGIFFDAAGTLVHLPKGVGWHYRDVARRHGCDLPEEGLNRAFRSAWKASLPLPETRLARPDDDRDWWRALVDRVLDDCRENLDGLNRDAYFAELYSEFARPGIWELYPEVEAVLKALAPHFSLGVLSNFDGRLRTVLKDLGLAEYFEHWIISSEVGAEKPSPWVFQKALAVSGFAAEETLHVGDDPACDWEGAAAAGLQVFRLDRPKNSLLELLSLIG